MMVDESSTMPSVNALVFYLASRDVYRPVIVSTREIFCSPDCATSVVGNRLATLHVPAGQFDIADVLREVPAEQKPELVVIKADASARMLPRNLGRLSCPRVLVAGDTHHFQTPIRTLIDYARHEPFDLVVGEHDRHHLHFFREAGIRNVRWIPAFSVYPHLLPPGLSKKYGATFVGQVGRWHPYRRHVLSWLRANGVSFDQFRAPHEQAARIYAESAVNLNVSLNGDLNLRVFEVLSSGGFLLTDRLSTASGLDLLFADGEHLVTYRNEVDLKEKILAFVDRPDEAREIATRGREQFERCHRPETKIAQLLDAVSGGPGDPLCALDVDDRVGRTVVGTGTGAVAERVEIYEYLQLMHLSSPVPRVMVSRGTDLRVAADLSDLPRLLIDVDAGAESACVPGYADNVRTVPESQVRALEHVWDAVIAPTARIEGRGPEGIFALTPFVRLIVADRRECDGGRRTLPDERLTAMGLVAVSETPLVYGWTQGARLLERLVEARGIQGVLPRLREWQARSPEDALPAICLGHFSLKVNDEELARTFFEHAVEVDGRSVEALVGLATVSRSPGTPGRAAWLLKRAVALDSSNDSILLRLAQALLLEGKVEEALQACERLLKVSPDCIDARKIVESLGKVGGACCTGGRPALTPRRILVINNIYPPQELGGYGRLMSDFAGILGARGHTVRVLTSDTAYLGAVPDPEPGVCRRLELFGEWKQGVARFLEEDVVERVTRTNLGVMADALDDFSPEACLLGNMDFLGDTGLIDSITDRGIPVVHHLGGRIPGYSPTGAPRSPLYRMAAASGWLRDDVWRNGYPLEMIEVAYPGAFVRDFYKEALVPLDKLRIAYAGIVLPYKGVQVLAKALINLRLRGVDFVASIAGSTTNLGFMDGLRGILDRAGLAGRVEFRGYLEREDLKELYRTHNVLVFPSIVQEAFGISQVEAMASGLAVVTSGTGGAAEIVEHDKSGVVFRSGDDESLAAELERLAADRERWDRLRRAGRRRALECFDIHRSVDELERIFSELSAVR